MFALVEATCHRHVAFVIGSNPSNAKERNCPYRQSRITDTKLIVVHRRMPASAAQWILPRAKKCPPDPFCTSVRTGAALSNPISSSANKKTTPKGGFFVGKVDRNEPLPPKNSGSQELNGWNLQRINMFQKLLKVKTKVGQNGFHVIAYLIQIASAKENRYNTNEITVEELEIWKKKNLDLFYSA